MNQMACERKIVFINNMNKLRKQIFVPEFKQLSLGIFATAIGVGLTFFVNNMVDNNHESRTTRNGYHGSM